MPTPLRIDFVSDVACPWCVVGLRSLRKALERLNGDVSAEIVLQPFELNPDMPPEGENMFEHVQRKYGSTQEGSFAVRQALKDHGEALGFAFNYTAESRIWNTFDAHRLLHWAGSEDRHIDLKDALFKANFTDHAPISDHDTLARIAAFVGLDEKAARDILASDQYAGAVREAEEVWRNRGIHAVPSIIFNQRWLIQGGQAPEVFEQAIRQIVSGAASEAGAQAREKQRPAP